MRRRDPTPIDDVRGDRDALRRRITLAIALRHPRSARWPLATRNGRKRMAPKPGGWVHALPMMEWNE